MAEHRKICSDATKGAADQPLDHQWLDEYERQLMRVIDSSRTGHKRLVLMIQLALWTEDLPEELSKLTLGGGLGDDTYLAMIVPVPRAWRCTTSACLPSAPERGSSARTCPNGRRLLRRHPFQRRGPVAAEVVKVTGPNMPGHLTSAHAMDRRPAA